MIIDGRLDKADAAKDMVGIMQRSRAATTCELGGFNKTPN